ncbi:MAG: mannonate dehydratase [Saprospiraceae bacterium]|nr:mannonate dehydratase [Saprospiraceae bacterium]MCB0572936.1 mannonate dehydratase [Saprospiraceae bacterium]MCB9355407.1 mannonate dehydratase [Lewinellaceae bacterium]
MAMIQSWRWYGPHDIVSLTDIEQAGATGIVSALHHIPVGEVWSVEEIDKRKRQIEWHELENRPRNLRWVVVESVNIHESIRMGLPEREIHIENYCATIRNLAACGLDTVCYNFMPVLDWTRTDLAYQVPNGAKALRYDAVALAAFDLYMLQRPEAEAEYDAEMQAAAKAFLASLTSADRRTLQNNVLAGLPGTLEVIGIEAFRDHLKKYEDIDSGKLREHLRYFLQKTVPVAEQAGVKLCIHPDDPPYPIFGLPRVVSTEEDLQYIVDAVDSPSNGITFCTGSLGPRPENDLPGMVRRLGHKFHFVHLRNIQRQDDGSFYEADHMGGSVDMLRVGEALVDEVRRREKEGAGAALPFRPDHGHQMLDDLNKNVPFPGYSAIGRLRGLAELRGLMLGVARDYDILG